MAVRINKVHHIAIICSDYSCSLLFYTNILGFRLLSEHYREHRDSYKADLALGDNYVIELFSFPEPPKRPSFPEAVGLRHIAFEVDDVQETLSTLQALEITCEPIRIDEITRKQFFFIADPDNLPIEFYQAH